MRTYLFCILLSILMINLFAQDTLELNNVELEIRATMSKGESDILADAIKYDSLASLGENELYKGKGKNFLGMSHHL